MIDWRMTSPRRRLALVSLALFAACSPAADTSAAATSGAAIDSAASRGVDSTVARLTAAVLRGDVNAVLQDFAENYVSLETPGQAVPKPAYRSFLDSLMANGRITELVYEPLGKHYAGDMVVHYGHWRMRAVPNKGEPSGLSGNYMHVYRRQSDGVWRLATEISNAVPVAVASTAAAKP